MNAYEYEMRTMFSEHKIKLSLAALVGIGVLALPPIVLLLSGMDSQPTERIEETDSAFMWASGWESQEYSSASGGTWKVSRIPGSKAVVSFTGTGVALHYAKGPQSGIATIELDGESYPFIDMYSPVDGMVNRTIARDLKKTHHTLVITVSKIKNLKSSNSFVVVDAVEIALK